MSGNRSEPWDKRRTAGRRAPGLARRKVLILCEDEKSSCLYFKGFRLDPERVDIVAVGTGCNTDSLVQEAIERKRLAIEAKEPFNNIWCVFDRDSFPKKNFRRAFELAQTHRIHLAWSNEAFELWYLLHFHYHDTGMCRDQYAPRLKKLLGKPYQKNDPQMYDTLLPRQEEALRNARRLEKHWNERGGCDPERDNPSTKVHELVSFLNEFLDPRASK